MGVGDQTELLGSLFDSAMYFGRVGLMVGRKEVRFEVSLPTFFVGAGVTDAFVLEACGCKT